MTLEKGWDTGVYACCVNLAEGGVGLMVYSGPDRRWFSTRTITRRVPWWTFRFVGEWGTRAGSTTMFRSVYVPLWAPFLLSGVPATVLWRAEFRFRRRKKLGLCLRCGYDRRGLAADAKCPECGK